MLKTFSAALLAASVIAAPALAANPAKNTQTPVIKAQAKPVKSNSSALNANAKMGKHHMKRTHHRAHKHMGALKTHKHVATKRG